MQRWKVGETEESKREKGNKEFREKKKTCRKKKGIKEGHTKGGGGEEGGEEESLSSKNGVDFQKLQ